MTAPRDHSKAVGGFTFHHVTWGPESAPPLVLLHGLTSHARSRAVPGRELSANRRVIALDQPEAFARAVRDFFEA
jgi:pimeloyl-ACP methyl ester carboxylesterase